MIFTIYKAQSPSGKYYIGYTSEPLEFRKSKHISCAFSPNHANYNDVFKRAIRKYGCNNIDWVILEFTDSLLKAHELEKYYVKLYDSFKNGYNSTLGGDGNLKWTDEDLLSISKQFNSDKEWRNKHRNSHKAAVCRGKDFLKKCKSHMIINLKRKHTDLELINIASKYSSKEDWRNNDRPTLEQARRRKILHLCLFKNRVK